MMIGFTAALMFGIFLILTGIIRKWAEESAPTDIVETTNRQDHVQSHH